MPTHILICVGALWFNKTKFNIIILRMIFPSKIIICALISFNLKINQQDLPSTLWLVNRIVVVFFFENLILNIFIANTSLTYIVFFPSYIELELKDVLLKQNRSKHSNTILFMFWYILAFTLAAKPCLSAVC